MWTGARFLKKRFRNVLPRREDAKDATRSCSGKRPAPPTTPEQHDEKRRRTTQDGAGEGVKAVLDTDLSQSAVDIITGVMSSVDILASAAQHMPWLGPVMGLVKQIIDRTRVFKSNQELVALRLVREVAAVMRVLQEIQGPDGGCGLDDRAIKELLEALNAANDFLITFNTTSTLKQGLCSLDIQGRPTP